MKIKVLVLPVHGNPYLTNVDNHYSSFNQIIGSRYIDMVELWNDDNRTLDCIIDDEGLLDGAEPNPYWSLPYNRGKINYPIYGTTVITTSSIESGETFSVDLDLAKRVLVEKYGFSSSIFFNLGEL